MTDTNCSDGRAVALSPATWRDYGALLKPRVMSLVVFTGLVGMMLAPGALHPVIGFAALLSMAAGAGAAGALNQWYEADLDVRMVRTRGRPLPQGRVPAGEALALGLFLAGFAVMNMGVLVNWTAATLLALTIAFYVLIYTMWLKRRTPQNIVIGGAAGALPPVIGWAAAGGGVAWEPLILFLIIFLWTPPHFWALAITRRDDYAAAGVPMLPVTAGVAATKRQILVYSVLLVLATAMPPLMGFAGTLYIALAIALGLAFLVMAVRLARAGTAELDGRARKLFSLSVLHLSLLFAALMIETLIGL